MGAVELNLDELEPGTPVRIKVGKTPVVVVRIGDAVHAIGDICSHDDYSLSGGDVDADDCTIECPKHGALFDLCTGEALTLPATRPVPCFQVDVSNGKVRIS
jgi:3-phenylpropionate/trans-cinnamate dioxygenase ferredoxin subunit